MAYAKNTEVPAERLRAAKVETLPDGSVMTVGEMYVSNISYLVRATGQNDYGFFEVSSWSPEGKFWFSCNSVSSRGHPGGKHDSVDRLIRRALESDIPAAVDINIVPERIRDEVKRQRAAPERVDRPEEKSPELEMLKLIAQQAADFRFWFNKDGSPCDGFRFRDEGRKLDRFLEVYGVRPTCLNSTSTAPQPDTRTAMDAEKAVENLYIDMTNSWMLGLSKIALTKVSLESFAHIRGTDIPLDADQRKFGADSTLVSLASLGGSEAK